MHFGHSGSARESLLAAGRRRSAIILVGVGGMAGWFTLNVDTQRKSKKDLSMLTAGWGIDGLEIYGVKFWTLWWRFI